MRAALLAVLSVAVAGCSHAPSPASLPNRADLTIRTRTTAEVAGATVRTTTYQFKGARERNQVSMESGGVRHSASVYVTQCDLRQSIVLNEADRTFVSTVIPNETVGTSGLSGRGASPPPPGRANVTVTIDSVDTGERRQFGQYVARHVVMTTTQDREGSPSEQIADVRDGWYIDIGPHDCIGGSGTAAFVMANVVAGVAERTHFVQRGRAPLGLPLEEVQRHTDRDLTFTTRTTLLEFSEAPLDAKLFALPSGYRPALRLPGGGYDFSQPDTVTNRAAAYWEAFTTWFSSIIK